jgi:hypothetical protein
MVSQSGTCTITAESCMLAQHMAMDCAVAQAGVAVATEIAQLDAGCKSNPIE